MAERYSVQIRVSRETRERLEGLRDQIPELLGAREIGDVVGMLSYASAKQVAEIVSKALILLAANPAAFEDEEAEEEVDLAQYDEENADEEMTPTT